MSLHQFTSVQGLSKAAERLGAGTALATMFPLFGEGHPINFWAERGLVKFEDMRPNAPAHRKTGALAWHIAAKHVVSLNEMVIKSSEDRRWSAERQRLQKFLCDMEQVIRQAKEQGGPLDGDAVRREYKRRRPVSVVVPTPVTLDF